MKQRTKQKMTYISLFSSAGVGCYGFKQNDFDCIASNELISRRMDVQKSNHKCKYESGYILGDITNKQTQVKLFDEIDLWKKNENVTDIDVVIATPPCQGMSVANHKKNNELKRNSLVINSIEIIKQIKPKFFIFENVSSFMSTLCTDLDGEEKRIGEAIDNNLLDKYCYTSKVLNFKNYGSNSSRTRTLVIGVRKDYEEIISPFELFPDFTEEKILRDVIGDLPSLQKFGEICDKDIYHSFRPYKENMREWIANLKEEESAFDNVDESKRPHRIVNGKVVYNVNKNGDKYKRQTWDKVAPCIHTRNDILASQNTIHPKDDRVFSARELMLLMTVPETFRWTPDSFDHLNSMSKNEKETYIKKNDINIRQSIGEAVPTVIFGQIASKIKHALNQKVLSKREITDLISTKKLNIRQNLENYIERSKDLSYTTLTHIVEMANDNREKNSAFYTNKSLLSKIYNELPTFNQDAIRILEPSVGCGNFIPFIISKYAHHKSVVIDVIDIDENSISVLKCLLNKTVIPKNVKINLIESDFLLYNTSEQYDLVVGNPPFNYSGISSSNNIVVDFLEKSMEKSNKVVMILPKNFLNTKVFKGVRSELSNMSVEKIIDFGEKGFSGVLIETICIFIDTNKKPKNTIVHNFTLNKVNIQDQMYIMENRFPYWLIYRNEFFDKVVKNLKLNSFTVFRDRQITNKLLSDSGEIRVLRSRNISDTGEEILDVNEYDKYIQVKDAKMLPVYKYLNSDNLYIVPNMTYKPRMSIKPRNTLVNGSLAILLPKDGYVLTKKQILYFSSDEFRRYYKVARNNATRSLNIDSESVYFFGILKGGDVNEMV